MLNFLKSYYHTEENTNYLPHNVSMSPLRCFESLKKWLEDNKFQEIDGHVDYLEIYAKKDKVEYTFSIHAKGKYSSIDVFTYGLKGKANRKLYEALFLLKESFK